MRNVFKASIRQLAADISDWQRRIVETQALIEQLNARAGIEGSTGGTRGTAHAAQAKPAPKRRRRRRHSALRHTPRHSAPRRRQKPVIVSGQVPAPAPVAAKVEPAKGVRSSAKFADQLEELKKLFVTIDTDEADAARAHSIIVELKGRSRLPKEYTKAVRMRLKRRAAAAGKISARAAAAAPKKQKKPRRPAEPIPPVHKAISDWVEDSAGVRSRQVVAS